MFLIFNILHQKQHSIAFDNSAYSLIVPCQRAEIQRLDFNPSVNKLSIADISLAVPQVPVSVYKGGRYKLILSGLQSRNYEKVLSPGKVCLH